MWTCATCQQRHDDDFDVCWNCGTSRAGATDPEFAPIEPAPGPAQAREVDCLRCGRQLDFLGTRRFHEGPRWGGIGDIGELFVNKEPFDIYVCSGCGHVEFFATGVGE